MRFSVITPSFKQLDWLRLCVASVRDQVAAETGGMLNDECCMVDGNPEFKIQNSKSKIPPLAVEHIIQDAGTPGIEDFAREIGADFYRDGKLISHSPFRIPNYSLTVYCEADAGMYDAVNRGIQRATGDVVSYINCDEQYLTGALSHLAEFFSIHSDCELLSAGCLVVDPEGTLVTLRPGLVPWLWHVQSDHLPVFTASLFYRRSLMKEKWKRFDTRYKDCADAAWILDRLRDGTRFQSIAFYTTAFTDTGENMNLMPNARAEAAYLRSTTPAPVRTLRPLWVALHRLRKFWLGCYRPQRLRYAIYLLQEPAIRKMFDTEGAHGIWKNRIQPTK